MSYQEIVNYKSAQAYYHIKFEKKDIIIAELQQYLGQHEHTPPKKVVYLLNEAEYEPSLIKDLTNATQKSNQSFPL